MNVLFDVTHPAHVHLFRNAISELEDRGANVSVCSREKDLTTELLDTYGIDHTILSKRGDGFAPLLIEWPLRELKSVYHYYNVDPDVVVSRFNPAASHATALLDIPHLVFDDTEDKPALVRKAANGFSDVIFTPDCFQLDLGSNQVRYPGYHELAYLHPNQFEPDPSIFEEIDVTRDEKIVILRLVSWNAVHDVGEGGFDDIEEIVSRFEDHGAQVIITSETELPQELSSYQASVQPHKMHDLLYYSDLFIGESATMATESAVLGTPAVFVSSTRRGYTDELEEKYGLVFNYSGDDRHTRGLEKGLEIIGRTDPGDWEQSRQEMLNEKIDTTEFIVNAVEKVV